jgi:aspartate/methionine/tyrosine aminotransferase
MRVPSRRQQEPFKALGAAPRPSAQHFAAIQGKSNSRQLMVEAFKRRRDIACNLLKEIKGIFYEKTFDRNYNICNLVVSWNVSCYLCL